MGEMVGNVQEMGDGIQVHPSFHTDVKELEYKDLMMRTFTQPDHQRVTEDSVLGWSSIVCLLKTQVSLVGDDGRMSNGPHVSCARRLCVSTVQVVHLRAELGVFTPQLLQVVLLLLVQRRSSDHHLPHSVLLGRVVDELVESRLEVLLHVLVLRLHHFHPLLHERVHRGLHPLARLHAQALGARVHVLHTLFELCLHMLQLRTHPHKPGVEGEFGRHTTSSITVGHRASHR
jgi:hypothetical protein